MLNGEEIPLWPGTAPGSQGLVIEECVEERSPDTQAFTDRAITGISRPRLAVFHPEKPSGLAILVVPGGGYQRIVWDSAIKAAQWLTGLGMTACVLLYRLPSEGHQHGENVPLQDAQRALRLMRAHAAAWNVDASRIGAMGFSAGGHVVSSLATGFRRTVYEARDASDSLSARPDFVVLAYPVISMRADIADPGSREKLIGQEELADETIRLLSSDECVTAETPESFIVLADDDELVPPANGVRYYLACHRAGVKAELHVYRNGGHGFGVRRDRGPVVAWMQQCEAWLRHASWLIDKDE
ncbi:MAG: hypothetical protein JWL63_1943 [Rhodocyclales bacterium]|nr:hypothetical protein [Rhodocyclales bacterium]